MAATSLDELRLISEQLAGEHTIRSIRDRAMILFGFATAFRRIEIAGFDLSDIELKPASLAISLGKSKADQEGKGRELVIPKAKDPGLCPILALNEWLEARGRWPGPLFTDIRGKKVLKLTRNRMEGSVVCYAVRAAAKRARQAAESSRSERAWFARSKGARCSTRVSLWRAKGRPTSCSGQGSCRPSSLVSSPGSTIRRRATSPSSRPSSGALCSSAPTLTPSRRAISGTS